MQSWRRGGRLISAGFVAALVAASSAHAQGPTTSESARWMPLTKGLVGSQVSAVQFTSAPLRLEIQDFVMGTGVAQNVPIPTRTIVELRGGAVTTTINGVKEDRRAGDFWGIDKDSALTLETRADVAVLRVIFVYEGPR